MVKCSTPSHHLTDVRIDAHLSGNIVWLDMFVVPMQQRKRGVGRAAYMEWEKSLSSLVTCVKLLASDTGNGLSDGFWEAMGYSFQYESDEFGVLSYEDMQSMWKGLNGHPTPPSVKVLSEND